MQKENALQTGNSVRPDNTKATRLRSIKEMPGPKELPLIGSLLRVGKEPIDFLRSVSEEYGDLATFTVAGTRFVLVSNPEYVRTILVEDAAKYPKSQFDMRILSPYLGRGLLTNPEPESHRQNRKLVAPAFHHKRIQGYAEIMREQTEALVLNWRKRAGEEVDMSEEMMRLTLLIVAQSLFAESPEVMEPLVKAVGFAVSELQEVVDEDFGSVVRMLQWLPTPGNRRRKNLRETLHGIIDGIIAKRLVEQASGAEEDRGDLLSMLLLSTDEETGQRLTHEQVRDEVVTIMLAGHETTSNAMTWTWHLLAEHPEVAAKLHAEVDSVLGGRVPGMEDLRNLPYTAQVFKEALRLYPPAWVLNTREATTEVVLGEYALPKGTQFFVSPYIMHHRADLYPDPDAFRPERWTPEFEKSLPRFAYYPFGGGARVCIGNSFAQMEAAIMLAGLAANFAPQPLRAREPELLAQITLSVKDGLPMRLQERTTPS